MRRTSKWIALMGACLLAAPAVAMAGESVEAQLEELNARMEQMEGQLAAAEAQVAEQEQVIEASEREDRQGGNALSAFIESTEISSWVATSYNINFRNPQKSGAGAAAQGSTNQGSFAGLYNLYFPDSNTFQLDQIWIGINKAPTEESRAGFNLDLNGGQAGNGASYQSVGIYSASASYMFPIADGFTVTGGLIPTAQGAEVQQIVANYNITRGITWNLQPVTNLGATGTLAMGDLSVMIGGLNNSFVLEGPQDANNAKALTSRVNYGKEKWSLGAGVNFTRSLSTGLGGTSTGLQHVLANVLASVSPTENWSAYADYTLHSFKNGSSAIVHTLSLATRLAVLDTTGIAVRGELVRDTDGFLFGTPDGNLWTVTGTIDHALTDNFTLKGEIKYDGAASDVVAGGGGFYNGGVQPGFWNGDGTATNKDSQVLFIAQIVYEF